MAIGTGGGLGSVWSYLGINTTGMKVGAAQAKGIIGGVNADMAGMEGGAKASAAGMSKAFLGIGTVFAAIGAASAVMAMSFDKSMREVWTLVRGTEERFQDLKDSVVDMSKSVEHSAQDLAKGMYWVVSALPDASDSKRLEVLEWASKAATAGVSDLADTADVLTTAMNAWKIENPERVMDALLKTVERGKTTLQELAGNLSKAAAAAAMAGVPIETLGAAAAGLTRAGIPTDRAMMSLNRTFIGLARPSEVAAKFFKDLGYESGVAMVKAEGFEGVLKAVHEAMGGNIEAMAEMFPNIRELIVWLQEAGVGFNDFVMDMEEFGDSAGTANAMFDEMAKTAQYKAKVALNEAKAVLLDLGKDLLPMVSSGISLLSQTMESLGPVISTVGGAVVGLIDGFKLLNEYLKAPPVVGDLFAAITGQADESASAIEQLAAKGMKMLSQPWTIPQELLSLGDIGKGATTFGDMMDGLTESFDTQHQAALELATELIGLREAQAGLEGDALTANLDAQQTAIQNLGGVLPGFIQNLNEVGDVSEWDAEVLASLGREAGLAVGGVGDMANAMGDLRDKQVALVGDMQTYTAAQQVMLEGLTAVMGSHEKAVEVMGLVASGAADWELIEQAIAAAGEEGERWGETILDAGQTIGTLSDIHGGNITKMNEDLKTNEAAWDMWKAKVRDALISLTAAGPSAALTANLNQVIQLIRDKDPEMRSAGRELMNEFWMGLVQTGIYSVDYVNTTLIPQMKAALDTDMTPEGQALMIDFYNAIVASGAMPVEAALDTALGVKVALGAVDSGPAGLKVIGDYLEGMVANGDLAVEEALRIKGKVMANLIIAKGFNFFGDGGGEMADTVRTEGDKAVAEAEKQKKATEEALELSNAPVASYNRVMNNIRSVVTSKYDAIIAVAKAKQDILDATMKSQKSPPIDVWLPQVYKRAMDGVYQEVVGGYGRLESALGGGGAGGVLDHSRATVDALAATWDAWRGSLQGVYDELKTKPITDVDEALWQITGGSQEQIAAWRGMAGAITHAEQRMEELGGTLETEQEKLDGLNETLQAQQREYQELQYELEGYTKGLQEAGETMDFWTSKARLKGLTQAEGGLFQMDQESLKLKRAILLAEQDENYELAAAHQIKLDELEAERELAQLNKDIDYQPKLRAIEQAQSELTKEEYTWQQIRDGIIDSREKVKEYEAKIEDVNARLWDQELKIRDTNILIIDQQAHVKYLAKMYQELIDEVADYKASVADMTAFVLAKFRELQTAAGEVGLPTFPGYVPPNVGGGAGGGGGVTIHVPVNLDGQVIADVVGHYQGDSAYYKSKAGG